MAYRWLEAKCYQKYPVAPCFSCGFSLKKSEIFRLNKIESIASMSISLNVWIPINEVVIAVPFPFHKFFLCGLVYNETSIPSVCLYSWLRFSEVIVGSSVRTCSTVLGCALGFRYSPVFRSYCEKYLKIWNTTYLITSSIFVKYSSSRRMVNSWSLALYLF